MPAIKRFFANIQSRRDNGANIELNLRGTVYIDPGRHSGPPEDCYEAESEVNITRCDVIQERTGTNNVWSISVDFYEFTADEQNRFIDAAFAEMESDD